MRNESGVEDPVNSWLSPKSEEGVTLADPEAGARSDEGPLLTAILGCLVYSPLQPARRRLYRQLAGCSPNLERVQTVPLTAGGPQYHPVLRW